MKLTLKIDRKRNMAYTIHMNHMWGAQPFILIQSCAHSTIGSALIKSPGCAAVSHPYADIPKRARKELIAVRSSVM